MELLGSLIKGFIDARDAVVPDTNHLREQQKVLRELLDKASNTSFGTVYDFKAILASDSLAKEYERRVPVFDYERMNEWWRRLHDGEHDVTWPGNPDYFALSSGTTGSQSKKIPVTEDMIKSIRRTGIQQIYSLANFDIEPEFLEKKVLMLGSSTDLHANSGHLEGEISGISADNIPSWFRSYYKPGRDIAGISDWEQRVEAIARNARDWDIGAISGIPSWIELMLKRVMAYHEVQSIHDIWPHLRVYTSGGVAIEPYRKSFESLFTRPVQVIDTYLASEGYLAFQCRPETDAMQLVTGNGIYFEFVPFHPDKIQKDGSLHPNVSAVGLDEVQPGTEYVLLISTVSGAWRYTIGDTITFTDVERAEIKITGRTKFFLNTVGSQLSVNKLVDAVTGLESELGFPIPEFTVCAIAYDNIYYHHWFLGTSEKLSDSSQKAVSILDEYLKAANNNYRKARSKALEGVKVDWVHIDAFYDWNEEHKKKGGQVKVEKVMQPEDFLEWKSFADPYAIQ